MQRNFTFEGYNKAALAEDVDPPISVTAFQIIYESLFIAQQRPKSPGTPSEPWNLEQRRRNSKLQRLFKGISVPYPERKALVPPHVGEPRRLIDNGGIVTLEQVEVDHIVERISLVDWLPMLDCAVIDTLDFLSPNK